MAVVTEQVAVWLVHNSQTSASIRVYATDAVTVSVDVTGATNPANQVASLPTVSPFSVLTFDVNGLTAGQSYPYQVTVDGDTYGNWGGTLKTDPSNYNNYKTANIGCFRTSFSCDALKQVEANFCFKNGDIGYHDEENGRFGGFNSTNTPNFKSTKTSYLSQQVRLNHHIDTQLHPLFADFCHNNPGIQQCDDHEGVTNNYTGDLASINADVAPNGYSLTSTEIYGATNDAAGGGWGLTSLFEELKEIYNAVWSVPSDAEGIGGFYDDENGLYFSLIKGNTEYFFCHSQLYYSSTAHPYRASLETELVGRSILGESQRNRLKAALLASPATRLVIIHPKKLYSGGSTFATNTDGYAPGNGGESSPRDAEADNMMQWVEDNQGSLGAVMWWGGDRHTQAISTSSDTGKLHACSTPFSMDASTIHPYQSGVDGFIYNRGFQGYGIITQQSAGLQAQHLTVHGDERARVTLANGSKVFSDLVVN
jgi:hypothetical protein